MPARQKVIVLTGVSQGLGKALALQWASMGHVIYGCSRRTEAMDEILSQFPHNVKLSTVDVTDFEAVTHWSNEVYSEHPKIDLLVCNAGVCEELAAPWELEASTFSKVMNINVNGVFHTVKAFVPTMVKKEHGVIVNISSGLGRSTNPDYGAYCSSKFAVEGLSKCVAQALPSTMACVPLAPGVVRA
jgi:NAD(P)-dependent dehydrogenase (short-subunit alcohol dehydrogenase family)